MGYEELFIVWTDEYGMEPAMFTTRERAVEHARMLLTLAAYHQLRGIFVVDFNPELLIGNAPKREVHPA